MNRLREDADILSNPHFSSGEISEQAQEATKSAVENVTSTLDQLNSSYNKLTTMCQQKRDLFIVCVKFHMTTRQVGVCVCVSMCVSVSVCEFVCV